jgi:hypothetical protein
MQALPIFRCFLSILVVLVPSLYGKTTLLKKQTLPLSRLQTPTQSPAQEYKISEEKEWNIFVYMAGRNDLFFAIDQNLAQLMSVSFGSLCNIIVQVDKFGTSDVVRAHIKNGVMSPYWRASDTPTLERNKNPRLYNSGAVENFIDFLQTGMTRFKAKKQCVVIWDHGSGCFDPLKWRSPICRPDEEIISQTPTRGMAFTSMVFLLKLKPLQTPATFLPIGKITAKLQIPLHRFLTIRWIFLPLILMPISVSTH